MRKTLNGRHRADLTSSGLTDATIDASGIYSGSRDHVRDVLGFSGGSGMVIPYPGTEDDRDRPYRRVKPDRPFKGSNGDLAKYLSPKRELNRAGNRLFVPTILQHGVLQDPKVHLLVPEGEKKALAACQEGFAAVGLSGVACWVSRNGQGDSYPIADLDLIEWPGRPVTIAFDSDATAKNEVQWEEKKLAKELLRRGARVKIARLPAPTIDEDREHNLGGKFGIDDFLKVRGRDALREVLAKAAIARLAEPGGHRVPYADLADDFLVKRQWRRGSTLYLRWWREEFYRFAGTHYERVSDSELGAEVIDWLQRQTVWREVASSYAAAQIVANIKAVTKISFGEEPPLWLTPTVCSSPRPSATPTGEHLVFTNGIISIDDLLATRFENLHLHSPNYFALASLPFPLDPEADCRTWLRFLEEALPDPELRDLVQEMFGYLLVYDTSQQRFFLLEGRGANGKTVVCTVLREVLGESNVSAVGLEAFSATRTFPLAATIGKKANIVEELEEITKAAEGTLKNFVTGKPITIERKHVDPFLMTPTARLVFATNTLPRFVDRTDGLWRRMTVIPFRNQVLDEDRQDKRLIDEKFWQASGELPGVLLWALGGLARLRQRGRFTDAEASRVEKASYRLESNPAATFLQEHCAIDEGVETPSTDLYVAYREWAREHGYKPLSAAKFTHEVRREFPLVERSKNPRRVHGGKRQRVWTNLTFDGES